MDAVITYVDGLDPLWQADYRLYAGKPVLAKRYRDWNLLKYLFRGLETNLPYLRKVFLVVSRDSQVPFWIDRNRVRVVLHSEIIPAEFLPTFNSTAIEMYLHRIPGLDEQFLYFNDDMYPVAPIAPDELFKDGKVCVGLSRHIFAGNHLYRLQTRNSDRLARRAAGLRPTPVFIRPQHTLSPMLRSCCEEVFDACQDEIRASISRLREARNLNQYLFCDYQYHSGRAVVRRLPNKHFSLASSSVESICAFLEAPTTKTACINDVQMSEKKFHIYQEKLLSAFDRAFPNKSSYEL